MSAPSEKRNHNDLRTCDNLTLNQFCKNESSGAFIWSPTKSVERAGLNRQEFLFGNLNKFSEPLAAQQQKFLRTENSFLRTLQILLAGSSKSKIKKNYLVKNTLLMKSSRSKRLSEFAPKIGSKLKALIRTL